MRCVFLNWKRLEAIRYRQLIRCRQLIKCRQLTTPSPNIYLPISNNMNATARRGNLQWIQLPKQYEFSHPLNGLILTICWLVLQPQTTFAMDVLHMACWCLERTVGCVLSPASIGVTRTTGSIAKHTLLMSLLDLHPCSPTAAPRPAVPARCNLSMHITVGMFQSVRSGSWFLLKKIHNDKGNTAT